MQEQSTLKTSPSSSKSLANTTFVTTIVGTVVGVVAPITFLTWLIIPGSLVTGEKDPILNGIGLIVLLIAIVVFIVQPILVVKLTKITQVKDSVSSGAIASSITLISSIAACIVLWLILEILKSYSNPQAFSDGSSPENTLGIVCIFSIFSLATTVIPVTAITSIVFGYKLSSKKNRGE